MDLGAVIVDGGRHDCKKSVRVKKKEGEKNTTTYIIRKRQTSVKQIERFDADGHESAGGGTARRRKAVSQRAWRTGGRVDQPNTAGAVI